MNDIQCSQRKSYRSFAMYMGLFFFLILSACPGKFIPPNDPPKTDPVSDKDAQTLLSRQSKSEPGAGMYPGQTYFFAASRDITGLGERKIMPMTPAKRDLVEKYFSQKAVVSIPRNLIRRPSNYGTRCQQGDGVEISYRGTKFDDVLGNIHCDLYKKDELMSKRSFNLELKLSLRNIDKHYQPFSRFRWIQVVTTNMPLSWTVNNSISKEEIGKRRVYVDPRPKCQHAVIPGSFDASPNFPVICSREALEQLKKEGYCILPFFPTFPPDSAMDGSDGNVSSAYSANGGILDAPEFYDRPERNLDEEKSRHLQRISWKGILALYGVTASKEELTLTRLRMLRYGFDYHPNKLSDRMNLEKIRTIIDYTFKRNGTIKYNFDNEVQNFLEEAEIREYLCYRPEDIQWIN